MAAFVISNPITWLNIKLNGGWRRVVQVVSVTTLLILLVNTLFYCALDDSRMTLGAYSQGVCNVMLVIQGLIVLFGGPNAIKAAIHRDFTTEMISSHRQTGMRGASVVQGYLLGSTVHVTVLALLFWVATTVFALLSDGRVSAATPLVTLVILLVAAGMYWTLGVFAALATRGRLNLAGLIIIVGVLSYTGLTGLVPGLHMISGQGLMGIQSSSGLGGFASILVLITLLSQVVFAGIIYLAAARKYARDDVPAFSPILAYVLLAFSAVLAAVGLEWFNNFGMGFGAGAGAKFELSTQLIATLVSLLLVATMPVSAAVGNSAAYGYWLSRDPNASFRKPRSFIESSVIATLIVFAILGTILLAGRGQLSISQNRVEGLVTLGLLAMSFFFSLTAIAGLLRFVRAYTHKVGWVLSGYFVVFCVLPPVGELAISVAAGRQGWANDSCTWMFACSPVGAWIALVVPSVQAPLMIGLIFQGIVAAAALIFAKRARY